LPRFLLFLVLVSAAVYLLVRAFQGFKTSGPSRPVLPRLVTRRTPGPDDDPEFLRKVADDLWRSRKPSQPPDKDGAAPPDA
jgi:hypothetical protein